MAPKIDIVIPAFKAHKSIIRTLSSIVTQTIRDDLEVVIVNDACPEGSYQDIIDTFSPWLKIREVVLLKNGGPGVARQKGLEETKNPYITFIDADDTFAGAIALETLRDSIHPVDQVMCTSSHFLQLGEDVKHMVDHGNDMVWVFGKIYRRTFLEKYKIHFNETRANEDTGFNTIVRLLCDNPNEQLRFINETTYYWHLKPDSITRINDGQYALDQCFCGWTDNMIYAIKHTKQYRPFSGAVTQWIASTMMRLYYYWIETKSKKPVFVDQNFEYVKKFYHTCYKKIEDDLSDKAFAEVYSMSAMDSMRNPSMIGVIPAMGIKEFMDKVKNDHYSENAIHDIWGRMWKDPEARKLMENNIKCGVCAEGYASRIDLSDVKKDEEIEDETNNEEISEEET